MFDLDLSELDSMMSPELLSAMDNSIMSEDQVNIDYIDYDSGFCRKYIQIF